MSLEPVIVEMNRGDSIPEAYLYYGQDCRKSFRQLPEKSVHTICTSPPYWGLRDYGNEPSVWGGDESCDHAWGDMEETTDEDGKTVKQGQFCTKCDGWLGQLGLEPTPDLFIEHLVEIFQEARRVLRDDGTLWVNLGDSYANDSKWGGTTGGKHAKGLHGQPVGRTKRRTGLSDKDLVGIPWRFAFAAQADGWVLRQDLVWAKANVMPESVFDRCTRSHEFIFMFTKKPDYFYDHNAIKEKAVSKETGSKGHNMKAAHRKSYQNADGTPRGNENYVNVDGTRNKRSVWNVNPKPYKGAHFAVWPEELVKDMILAGSSVACCATCGAPHERVVERRVGDEVQYFQRGRRVLDATSAGWVTICDCNAATKRCVVLDPFSGSATTGAVAMKNGRDYVGFDANSDYLELARARIEGRAAPINEDDEVGDEEPSAGVLDLSWG